MRVLRTVCLMLGAGIALGVAQAQVPQPGTEPGSVPEQQASPSQAAPAPKPRMARISSGVMAGLKVSGDQPVYPAEARAQHVSGSVVLRAIIGKDGHVASLTVVSGSPMLADAALDAVKTWVYKPYLLNGEPTEVDTTVTVNFNLGAAPGPAQATAPQCRGDWLSGTNLRDCVSPPEGPVRVSSGVMAGLKAFGAVPVIPAGISTSGGVTLHAVIGKNGTVESLTAIHGSPELAQAVTAGVRQWRYKPYLLNGEPVEVDTTISLNW